MIELLNSTHVRKDFCCGKDLLDNYLKTQAGQDVRRKLAVCFVSADEETKAVKGYYTLSNGSISLTSFSETIRKKLPNSYQAIPITLLGRLAVDKKSTGKGIGKLLLIDALFRSYEVSKKIGSFAVVVDPIDEMAESFYEKYGFIKLPDSGKMFLPMKTIEKLFAVD